MREMLRGALGRSLRAMADEDRLAAAWVVACGRSMAEKGVITGFVDGVLRIEVEDANWLGQMEAVRGQLRTELCRIAGVEVREIHFERKGAARQCLPDRRSEGEVRTGAAKRRR